MAVIGTFSSFTTARLAIYASQAALNVTGNNIANINTEGYTRQRMDLVSLYSTGAAKFANIYNTNIGYGVLTNGTSQLRDPYLDIRYRDENSKLGQNDEWLDGLTQMSRILDEVAKGTGKDDGFGVIQAQLSNLAQSLENLSTKVSSKEYDNLVRSEADTLAKYLNQAAEELQSIWDNKRDELDDAVNDVNKLLVDIRDLNEKIRIQGLYGDKALELRDARNLALDKLSGYLKINVEYSMERIDQFTEVEKMTVTLADSKGPDGKPIKLIDGIYGAQLSIPEGEPVLNPDYNVKEIDAAKEEARKRAEEEDYPISNWDAFIQKRTDDAKDKAENELYPDDADWQKVVEDRVAAAQQKIEDEMKAKAQDPDNLTQEEQDAIDAAKTAEKAKVEAAAAQERADLIQAYVDRETKAATKEAQAKQQELIEAAVTAAELDAAATSGKYLSKYDDGSNTLFTNKLEDAYTDPNDKLLLQVEPLADERGRLMIDPNTVSKKSEEVQLSDTVLTGKLQAIRELLTEEGEYASLDDLGKGDADRLTHLSDDPDAATKKGIPYYQKVLDSFAQKLADEFNAMNQLPMETIYHTAADPVYVGSDGNLAKQEKAFLDPASTDPTPLTSDGDDKVVTVERLRQNAEIMADTSKTEEEREAAYDDYKACMDAIGVIQNCRDINGDSVTETRLNNLAAVLADTSKTEQELQAAYDIYNTCMDAIEEQLNDADNEVYVGSDGKLAKAETPFLDQASTDAAPVNLTDADGKPVTAERLADLQETLAGKSTKPEDVEARAKAYEEYEACMTAIRENGIKDPLYEFYDGGVLFSNNGNSNDPSGITAKNISVSIGWAEGPVRVLNKTEPDSYTSDGQVITNSSASDNIRHMITRFNEKLSYNAKDIQNDADVDEMFSGSFEEVFTAISATLADDAYTTTGKVNSYTLMTLDLDNDRISVSGVDLNDEATNMMQFSKSYAAACKLLTTLDSMLDKLINGTI